MKKIASISLAFSFPLAILAIYSYIVASNLLGITAGFLTLISSIITGATAVILFLAAIWSLEDYLDSKHKPYWKINFIMGAIIGVAGLVVLYPIIQNPLSVTSTLVAALLLSLGLVLCSAPCFREFLGLD